MLVYGHRGAAGEAPENTIAGCRHAIARGVRHIEIDLRLSADRQLVVVHDDTVDRMTGKRGLVSKFTARELAAMDCRAVGTPWPNKKGTGIPTLDALLAATLELHSLQLEVKPASDADIQHICRELQRRYRSAATAKRVIVTSSSYYLHECLRDMAPHIRRGMVVLEPAAIADLHKLGCQLCAIHWSACHPQLVRKMDKKNVAVSVWTVNDATIIKQLYKMKVHSVISDYPSMALPLAAALQR